MCGNVQYIKNIVLQSLSRNSMLKSMRERGETYERLFSNHGNMYVHVTFLVLCWCLPATSTPIFFSFIALALFSPTI